jgi:hypothetical protein
VVAAAKAPEVTTTPNSAQPVADSRPPGISVDKLDASQRATLVKLLQAYAVNFPEPIKADLFDQIARGESSVHFAWYGPLDMTKNHAFHIQSATLYVDFNNTQNGVNHIHTFVRSFVSDFGRPYSH